MFKDREIPLNKGRWLMLGQTSPTKETVLTHIRMIDGAEIKTVDTKTYIRFSDAQKKPIYDLFKISKILGLKHKRTPIKKSEINVSRHYCAVIIKSEK